MKQILNNKIFQIFSGLFILIVLIFVGIIAITNYYTQKEEVTKELSSFKKFKEEQIEKDILKINEEISSTRLDKYSDFNHKVERPKDVIDSINGGYCSESSFLGPEKSCQENGADSYECIRFSKCRIERYDPEFVHKMIADHAMLEGSQDEIDRAKAIYDNNPNWDIYSVVLAAKRSINNWMLKEAALSVWSSDSSDKTEKIEQDYEAVWFWSKECLDETIPCEGANVTSYKRDLLVFNKSGSLFYFLLDR